MISLTAASSCGVESLLPPHHEVGGPGAERRQDERYGKNDGASAHRGASAMGITGHKGSFSAGGNGHPRRPRLLAQDLLDPRDRLVDRLLGADALGGDAVDRLAPRALLPDRAVPPVAERLRIVVVASGASVTCIAAAMRCGSLGSSQNGCSSSFGIGGSMRSPEKSS